MRSYKVTNIKLLYDNDCVALNSDVAEDSSKVKTGVKQRWVMSGFSFILVK